MARWRGRHRGHGEGGHVNVVPLIDIVMVLIIFYLMVGSFINEDYESVPLPLSVAGETTSGADVLTINALPRNDGSGRAVYRVMSQDIDEAGIRRLIENRRTRDPDLIVQVRASRDLTYGAVEPAVRAVSRAGVARLRLVTESAQ
ncbi:MAG: ExbD/TolR family protein [Phycisphaerales bacterium]